MTQFLTRIRQSEKVKTLGYWIPLSFGVTVVWIVVTFFFLMIVISYPIQCLLGGIGIDERDGFPYMKGFEAMMKVPEKIRGIAEPLVVTGLFLLYIVGFIYLLMG